MTSNRAYSSFTHATVSSQVSSSMSHGVISVGSVTTDERAARASLSPG